jgi:hypothetical protein
MRKLHIFCPKTSKDSIKNCGFMRKNAKRMPPLGAGEDLRHGMHEKRDSFTKP